MFYSYRTGKLPITGKAWRKLEAAEKAAGIFNYSADIQPLSDCKVEETATFANDFNIENAIISLSERFQSVENQLRILTAAIAAILPSHNQPPPP